MLMRKAILSRPAAPGAVYVDDVFSAYTYTGTGSSLTITDNIDRTQGALDIFKDRGATGSWAVYDTARGVQQDLVLSTNAAETTQSQGVTATSSTGVTIGTLAKLNTSAHTLVKLTFRKAAKFFDIVTYTGNGSTQAIAHSLGAAPGMVWIKCRSTTGNWRFWHRGLASGNYSSLNGTGTPGSVSASNYFGNNTTTVDPTSSVVTIGSNADVNSNGATYVMYVFGHDTSASGMIYCGTCSEPGPGTFTTVNLGWEAQFVLAILKDTTGDRIMMDTMRGMDQNAALTKTLAVDSTAAEGTSLQASPNADGFKIGNLSTGSGFNYVFLAIRMPNKPPSAGTDVYNGIARTGTGAAANITTVGFTPDVVISTNRSSGSGYAGFMTRQCHFKSNSPTNDAATNNGQYVGFSDDGLTAFIPGGISVGSDSTINWINTNGRTYITEFFKRAPGFMDVTYYVGTASNLTTDHQLTVAPDLWIVKSYGGTNGDFFVGSSLLANTEKLLLNSDAAKATDTTAWNSTYPTSTQITVGTNSGLNTNTSKYAVVLFANLPGICKIATYTGDGTSGRTINCGFSAGARFVLIKRIDSSGDWFMWDSARGIVSGNDPHVSLNTLAAEVTTDDSLDPDSSGFIINQLSATNINVNGATYLYLAIA